MSLFLEIWYRLGRVNSNTDNLSRSPVACDDVESDTGVLVAHVSATSKKADCPVAQLREVNQGDTKVVRFCGL